MKIGAASKYGNVVTEYAVYVFFFTLWCVHFLYVSLETLSQYYDMERVAWDKTVYERHGLSNARGGSTNNHTFINTETGFEVTRYYSSISGINKSLWGLKKSTEPVGVSFYLRKEDYQKMSTGRMDYRSDVLGNKTIHQVEIPFFALRIDQKPGSTFSVLTDLWKYNYSLYTILYLLIPQALFLVNKKGRFAHMKSTTPNQRKMIGLYCAVIILMLLVDLLV